MSSVCCHHFVAKFVYFLSRSFCYLLMNIMWSGKYSIVSVSISFLMPSKHIAHNMNAKKYQMQINLSKITMSNMKSKHQNDSDFQIGFFMHGQRKMQLDQMLSHFQVLDYSCLALIGCHVFFTMQSDIQEFDS